MSTLQGTLVIGAMCIVVLVIGIVGKKRELFVNFILRTVTGVAIIYALNLVLDAQQIQLSVGINPISIAASGFLGVPGVILLYGIAGCRLL